MPPTAVDHRSAVRRVRRLLDDAGASLVATDVLALCSGGIDSVVLVELLARLPRGAAPRSVSVLWLDHGVRSDTESERRAAHAIAAAHDFEFLVERGSLTDLAGGTQAAARTWRYETATRVAVARGCSVVVTGHTASDQLEQALLGLVGATAPGTPRTMRTTRPLAPGVELVRPLLALTRDEIVALADAADLAWAEDPSNADPDAYLRNALRHGVVPPLLAASPAAGIALARAAEHAHTMQDALDDLASALLDAWRAPTAPQDLDVRRLEQLAEPARRALLAQWLRSCGLGRHLDSRLVRAVDRLAAGSRDGSLDLAGGACVRRDGYHVTLVRPLPNGDDTT